jgi:hypothetical protein
VLKPLKLNIKNTNKKGKVKKKYLKSTSNLTDSTRHLPLACGDWLSIFLEPWETDVQISCKCKLTTLPCCMFVIVIVNLSGLLSKFKY